MKCTIVTNGVRLTTTTLWHMSFNTNFQWCKKSGPSPAKCHSTTKSMVYQLTVKGLFIFGDYCVMQGTVFKAAIFARHFFTQKSQHTNIFYILCASMFLKENSKIANEKGEWPAKKGPLWAVIICDACCCHVICRWPCSDHVTSSDPMWRCHGLLQIVTEVEP